MRIFLIAAAGLMLAPLSASACEVNFTDIEASVPAIAVPVSTVQAAVAAQVTPVVADDLSAAKKKEKVEYMKSAAGPEPTAKKAKKSKKKKKTKK